MSYTAPFDTGSYLPQTALPADIKRLDARGLLCPMPTVKAALALEKIPVGGFLELWVDDVTTRAEFPRWCEEQGHKVRLELESGNFWRILVQRGEG